MKDDLTSFWPRAHGYQRSLYVTGALLMLAGLAHGVVFLLDPQPWAGPLGWRKPIEFGISLGITGVVLGWVMTWLPRRNVLGWAIAVAYSVPAILEELLIAMQAWRGVPSHFNESTSFDGAVFSAMGLAIAVVGLAVAVLTVWALASLRRPPSMALAIVAGLVLLLVGQLLGVLIVVNGSTVVNTEVIESFSHAATLGEGGDMKVPHAVALHGIQVLPVLAWLLGFAAWSERGRTLLVGIAAAGYTAVVGATVLQMYAERPLSEIGILAGSVAGLGVLALAGAYLAALLALYRSRDSAPYTTSP